MHISVDWEKIIKFFRSQWFLYDIESYVMVDGVNDYL